MDSSYDKLNLEKIRAFMDEKRFLHTIGVSETATKLAELYGVNIEQTRLAALLHDCARTLAPEDLLLRAEYYNLEVDPLEKMVPDLLHGKVGAEMARQHFQIEDTTILDAIRHHTLGAETMTTLDKIIFVADMIEPNRCYPGVEYLRKLAGENLDKAFLAGLNSTIIYVIQKGGIIHPTSIIARNTAILAQQI